MERDSLGQVSLLNLEPLPPERLVEGRFSRKDAVALVALMVNVYGEKRGADMEVLVDQWHGALGGFKAAEVKKAWEAVRNRRETWPVPALLVAAVEAQRFGMERGVRFVAEPPLPFCRDGRTQEEEVAYRKAFIAAAKERAGWTG